MSWSNRVIWQEGMFLRAQHFQQQDRWTQALVQARAGMLRPYPWGLTACTIDRNLLATGRFALAAAAGVFEDGTPFVLPAETEHPAPLEPAATARNVLVYLATPIAMQGAPEVALADEETEGRYTVKGFDAYDTQPRSHAEAPQPAELQVGRLRLRYMLETQDRAGYHGIAVARITEVAADRRITLDDRWIPPALVCAAAPPLTGLLAELTGMLNQRGEALASRLSAPTARGVAEVTDFLLLQMVNRWQMLLSHWSAAGNIHPEDFYAALVQMAGEFATYTEVTRRANSYPGYRHEDLQRSFMPVVSDLRRSLSAVLETTAVAVPLQERRHGVRVGPLDDRSLLRNANFVLSIRADVPAETLRRQFPSQVKIGAVEHITNLVNVALPGIAVRPLNVAPRQIPFYAGASYFELDRNSPHWQQMQSSGGFAIFVSGEFPNLQMELWAIRGNDGG
jgi:type VI secretion system protein ImpJ